MVKGRIPKYRYILLLDVCVRAVNISVCQSVVPVGVDFSTGAVAVREPDFLKFFGHYFSV